MKCHGTEFVFFAASLKELSAVLKLRFMNYAGLGEHMFITWLSSVSGHLTFPPHVLQLLASVFHTKKRTCKNSTHQTESVA